MQFGVQVFNIQPFGYFVPSSIEIFLTGVRWVLCFNRILCLFLSACVCMCVCMQCLFYSPGPSGAILHVWELYSNNFPLLSAKLFTNYSAILLSLSTKHKTYLTHSQRNWFKWQTSSDTPVTCVEGWDNPSQNPVCPKHGTSLYYLTHNWGPWQVLLPQVKNSSWILYTSCSFNFVWNHYKDRTDLLIVPHHTNMSDHEELHILILVISFPINFIYNILIYFLTISIPAIVKNFN